MLESVFYLWVTSQDNKKLHRPFSHLQTKSTSSAMSISPKSPYAFPSLHFLCHPASNVIISGRGENKDGDEKARLKHKTTAVYENLQLCHGSLRLARLQDWLLWVMWTAGMGTYFP